MTAPVRNAHSHAALEELARKYKLPTEFFSSSVLDAYLELDHRIKQQLDSEYDAAVELWDRHVVEARDYLTFSLGERPSVQIKEIPDPRAAYRKLEALYSNTQVQPNFRAWKKWVNLRYERSHPVAFVRRFKTLLQDVRDQGIEVSGDVELAQFKSVITQRPGCLQFVANLRVDPKMEDYMNSVYTRFIRHQLSRTEVS